MPDAPDDPTESEIAGAADKLETMLRGSHPSVNIFFCGRRQLAFAWSPHFEAYLWTSGESNRHRQSVRDVYQLLHRDAYPSVNIFFQPDNLGALSGVVAAGEIAYLANFHPRQICQVVYDYCSRTVVARAD